MNNAPGVLARLFGRGNPAPVVSSLALAALDRPLLVEPAMAESIIGAYLTGDITSMDTVLQVDRVPAAAPVAEAAQPGTIGVINISGGLVNRPMPGPSGAGPVSYVALRDEFDALMDDDSVTAIVLRIESPGGLASGCFDLTDHIFEARGKKPIHALIDDYAYSGAYAIAAACDEVWISRTGGAGSIGAAGFHFDRSGANAQGGIKVTAIYAGARKIDMNPNFPLSDEARTRAQASVDRLREMFVQSIARYRGLEADVVRATEADVYQGQDAIAAGLATKMGGWREVMAAIGAPAASEPAAAGDDDSDAEGLAATPPTADDAAAASAAAAVVDAGEQLAIDLQGEQPPASIEAADAPPQLTAEQQMQINRAAVLEAAQAAKLPDQVVLAVAQSIAVDEEPAARIEHAKQVVNLCTTAGRLEDAAAMVAKHTPIPQVRASLIEAKAKADQAVQLQTTLPAVSAEKPGLKTRLDPLSVYRSRGK